jgi:hypothetical protein
MITRLDSISGVIISVLASSVVNHDYKLRLDTTDTVQPYLVIMIYHTRSQHTNNYTTNTVQPCNHDLPH